MAEGGEMNSDAIVDAGSNFGGGHGDEDAPERKEVHAELVAPLTLGDDPWGSKTSREEWRAVQEEEARKVVIDEDDLSGDRLTAADVARVVDTKLEASFAGELPTPRAIVAVDCGLSDFAMSAEARAVVISLDVSRSKLVSLASLVSGGWLWLRELKLSGNRIKNWPGGLAAAPALLSLDLSFNPISLAGADLRPLAGLVRLELSGCDLTNLTGAVDDEDSDEGEDETDSGGDDDDNRGDQAGVAGAGTLTTPLAHLVSLVELNLTDNDIASIAALMPLSLLPALRDLDLNDNDVRAVRGYKTSMLTMLPELMRLDGDGTGQGTVRPRGRLEYGDSGTAAVFSANVDRSSCSCVEGDPCVDGALCLDWKGRYTVAMLARRRKGYFGDNGSN